MTTNWTPVPKPIGTTSVVTNIFTGGNPIGLLLALTYSQVSSSVFTTSIWTPVNSNSTSWTGVPKAT